MSDINLEQIKNMRMQFRKEADSIRAQIKQLQTQLIQCEERVQVYDELLKGKVSTPEQLSVQLQGRPQEEAPEESVSAKKNRTSRTTKAEMQRRRNVLIAIFKENGNMKPSDLLPLASEAIGVEVEPHQLRAILRRFGKIFEGKEEHGMWGLTTDGANIQLDDSLSEDSDSDSE